MSTVGEEEGGKKSPKLAYIGNSAEPRILSYRDKVLQTSFNISTLYTEGKSTHTMPPKSKKADPKSNKPTTTPTPRTSPNWPPLRPLLPAADLSLTPLLTDQIYLIRNFLPGTLCKNYASFLVSLPLTTTPGKPKKDEALRVNDRFQIDDSRFAEMLWGTTALKELVTTRFAEEEDYEEGDTRSPAELAERARQLWGGEPLGLNPNIRIYRYSAGQFFGQHCKILPEHNRHGYWPVKGNN